MIAQFDRETFEKALPVKRVASLSPMVPAPIETKLWKPLGIVQGEYAYLVPVREPFSIMVRSSVRPDGVSAATGKDSIRCWIVNGNIQPWGSRIGRYITRVPGWEHRLIDTLRALWKMILLIDRCPIVDNIEKCSEFARAVLIRGNSFLVHELCERQIGRHSSWRSSDRTDRLHHLSKGALLSLCKR